MKRILIILIFFPNFITSQVKVLSDINFLANDYKLVFNYERRAYDTINLISNSFKDFVISDKEQLIELQNNWIATEETDELMECGYDYSIYLINIGLPYLVDIQTEKRIPFVASIILIAIACNLLLKYAITILLQLL